MLDRVKKTIYNNNNNFYIIVNETNLYNCDDTITHENKL